MGSSPRTDFLIVGAGVFGTATALYLAKHEPSARIVLLDRAACPSPSAASSDVNKIVRADYDDLFYMRLALEALEEWQHNKLYAPFFHQSGMLFAENSGMGQQCLQNYKTLGVDPGAVMLTPSQARARFPALANANWTGVEENYFNPSSGWAEADSAMRAVHQAALDAGVISIQATASTLQFGPAGECTGILTTDGEVLTAEHTLLCTGAYTPQLLADSAPQRPALHAGTRLIAAAAASCVATCGGDDNDDDIDATAAAFHAHQQHNPVHFLGLPHTRGESVPADAAGRLKFNFECSFTNLQQHRASGQTISVPPRREDQSVWTGGSNGGGSGGDDDDDANKVNNSDDDPAVPAPLQHALRRVVEHVYGPGAPGLRVRAYRLCWDAVTPTQDFLVAPHPACARLFVAAGGSFHAWKFLPVLGKYVASMLRGGLEAEAAARWAWDRAAAGADDGAACVMYIPKHDLRDFQGAASGDLR